MGGGASRAERHAALSRGERVGRMEEVAAASAFSRRKRLRPQLFQNRFVTRIRVYLRTICLYFKVTSRFFSRYQEEET
jgi:hypothetical protein